MNDTRIGWTNKSWNPVHGCSKVSPGCDRCYAERLSLDRGLTKLAWTGENAAENVQTKPHKLREPYTFKESCMIFVNSMSDLYHKEIPDAFIAEVFKVMNECPQHVFQILTKRPRRAAKWQGKWSENIWQGTSIESRKYLYRIDQLRECPANVRFLSLEPLLEPLGELNLEGIHWVIVGGESGPGFRPMNHGWAREIRDQCVDADVPFFFKQSAAYKNETGSELEEADGTKSTWHEFPLMPTPPPPEAEQLTLL